MHLVMVIPGLLLGMIFSNVNCVPVGTIQQAKITSSGPSIWMYNQSSSSECLCYSLQHPPVVAFNYYKLNSSCQLFSNLSSYSFQITSNSNVTVYLLEPLREYAPCCSNLTWLVGQVMSTSTSLSIPSITSAVLDISNNQLGIVASTKLQLISATFVSSLNMSVSLPPKSQTISYHQGLFYVGIFPVSTPYMFHIYSALNLTKVGTMNFTQGGPQRIIWLFNDTLACILLQMTSGSSSIAAFYNWPSNTLNASVTIGISNAYGLGKAPDNDEFVFITDALPGGGIWQLKTTSPYNFTKLASSENSNESPSAVGVDGCNRLWATFANFGIRIYDINSRTLLIAWNLTSTYPTLYDMVLTDQYEIYLADKTAGKLVRFGSQLQCTN